MNRPQRIACFLPDLGGGGTERLTIDLMAGFLKRGLQVDLVLQRLEGEFLPLVPAGVRLIDLSAPRLRAAFRPLRLYLADAAPDALIAAMWPLTSVAIVAAAGLRVRVLVSDHCPLREQYRQRLATRATLKASVLATYRFADEIVAVSGGVGREIAGLAGIAASRVRTIPNPVGPPLRSDADPDALWGKARGTRILSVGKLKPEKNQALLIAAFHQLAQQRDTVLALVGDGPERSVLMAQAVRLGLADRVLLPGFTATPGDWYAGADLFALASDYEGMGNVLVEAMHAGLPVVSTDCPFGPKEVLGDGRWGELVPCGDSTLLAEAMARALSAPRNAAAQQARAREFSIDRAVDSYWRLAFPQ